MKKLKIGFKSAYGRNRGLISSYHRQKGSKKLYKIIDFGRNLLNVKGKVKFIEKDSYRTGFVAGICYTNGYFSYMLAVDGLKVGDFIVNSLASNTTFSTVGVSCLLANVRVGEKISNIEWFPGMGGRVTRSAGTFSKIIKKYADRVLIKLNSGEFRLFFNNCMCTIGRVSNIKHNELNIKNAGFNRLLGWRPVVRGRAMNPVDHPHGGRTNGGITPRTPWGALTRGVKTVKNFKACIIKKKKKINIYYDDC
jgi:large subunit ribosomal protein L2